MTELPYLAAVADYVKLVKSPDAMDPLSRAMLSAFVEFVQPADRGPVADLGCGPGGVTAYLAARGVAIFGVDLSPRMIDLARAAYPGRPVRAYGGRPVTYESFLLPLDRITELLGQAGLVVTARLLQEPDEGVRRPQACILARKPE